MVRMIQGYGLRRTVMRDWWGSKHEISIGLSGVMMLPSIYTKRKPAPRADLIPASAAPLYSVRSCGTALLALRQ